MRDQERTQRERKKKINDLSSSFPPFSRPDWLACTVLDSPQRVCSAGSVLHFAFCQRMRTRPLTQVAICEPPNLNFSNCWYVFSLHYLEKHQRAV